MSNYVVTVRYGLMATTERFSAESDEYRADDEVIVRTARGIDAGVAMGRAREKREGEETQGELLRPANESDRKILTHIRDSKEPEEFVTCQECIRERSLPMRLVGVEHLFSGDKIIFYFLAENRVDFRELVKELARRYRTRIEMRQIGVRDEARLLADYEHCGRELCCRTFIRNLEPVTMRMAKMQKTTLDPSKISGHCGRLMCCLRFEDEVYSALQAEMPARGSVCVTEKFTGEVASFDMFKREILLTLPDGSQELVSLDEITEIKPRKKPAGAPPPFAGQGGQGGGRPSGRFRSGDGARRGGRFDGGGPREGGRRGDAQPSRNEGGNGGGENGPSGSGGKPRCGNGCGGGCGERPAGNGDGGAAPAPAADAGDAGAERDGNG